MLKIDAIRGNNIYIVGDENGNLNTGDFITRAEFCTIYNRIIGRENALLKDAAGNVIGMIQRNYDITSLSNFLKKCYDGCI